MWKSKEFFQRILIGNKFDNKTKSSIIPLANRRETKCNFLKEFRKRCWKISKDTNINKIKFKELSWADISIVESLINDINWYWILSKGTIVKWRHLPSIDEIFSKEMQHVAYSMCCFYLIVMNYPIGLRNMLPLELWHVLNGIWHMANFNRNMLISSRPSLILVTIKLGNKK